MRAVLTALVILAALLIALPSGPSAQKMLESKQKGPDPGQKKKSNEDKDYKAAVDRLPDQKFDPWRNMR